jgi:hypothetical protein
MRKHLTRILPTSRDVDRLLIGPLYFWTLVRGDFLEGANRGIRDHSGRRQAISS